MKKLFTILFVLISTIAFTQNVVVNGPPRQTVYSSSFAPASSTGSLADLWLQSNTGIGYLYQKRTPTAWYRFFQTIDTTSTLATQSFVNSHGFGTGTVTSIATSTGITGGTITTTGTLKADTSLLATQNYVGRESWKTTGNSGTNAGTNFIGTTDTISMKIGSNVRATNIGNSQQSALAYYQYPSQSATGNIDNIMKDSINNGAGEFFIETATTTLTHSNFTVDTIATLAIYKDSIQILFNDGANYVPFTVCPTGIRIQDGTQGNGKILTSDANGIGTWSANLNGVAFAQYLRFADTTSTLVTQSDINGANYLGKADSTLYATKSFVQNNYATTSSSTYTPTLTNVANVSASTAYVTGYYRVGAMVTVFGKLDIDATLAVNTATDVDLSLPVASNLAAEEDLAGTAVSDVSVAGLPALPARIKGNVANDRAIVSFNSLSLTNDSYSFHFSYQVK